MRKLILTLLVPAFAAALLVGCVQSPEKNTSNNEFCEGTSCENTPLPAVTGVFVSGHLGNYRDCPGDGYTGDQALGGAGDRGGVSPQGDIAEGACPEDVACEPILNCEDAQATVNVSNSGDADALGLQVDRVELYNSLGELVAELPVIATTEAGAAFDGQLDVDETLTLRIDFQGPENPYTLLNTADESGDSRFAPESSGTVRIILSGDNHGEVTIEGKEIFSVPSIDT